jgi:hypothetical protein
MVKIIRITLYIGIGTLIFGDTVTQNKHFVLKLRLKINTEFMLKNPILKPESYFDCKKITDPVVLKFIHSS